jgi:hypothetical protein
MTDFFRTLGLIQKSFLSKKKAVKFPSKCASELVLHLRGLNFREPQKDISVI